MNHRRRCAPRRDMGVEACERGTERVVPHGQYEGRWRRRHGTRHGNRLSSGPAARGGSLNDLEGRDRAIAQIPVDALLYPSRAVLDIEGSCWVNPKGESGAARIGGLAALPAAHDRAAAGPVQPVRQRARRDLGAHDLAPVRDECAEGEAIALEGLARELWHEAAHGLGGHEFRDCGVHDFAPRLSSRFWFGLPWRD